MHCRIISEILYVNQFIVYNNYDRYTLFRSSIICVRYERTVFFPTENMCPLRLGQVQMIERRGQRLWKHALRVNFKNLIDIMFINSLFTITMIGIFYLKVQLSASIINVYSTLSQRKSVSPNYRQFFDESNLGCPWLTCPVICVIISAAHQCTQPGSVWENR
jgi:hypothetical protein